MPACLAGHGAGSVERRELSAGKPLLRMAERLWDRRLSGSICLAFDVDFIGTV